MECELNLRPECLRPEITRFHRFLFMEKSIGDLPCIDLESKHVYIDTEKRQPIKFEKKTDFCRSPRNFEALSLLAGSGMW